MGATRTFEERGYAGSVHALGGFAVNGKDFITGPNAGLVGGGPFKGIEDDDLRLTVAIGDGLGLDGHADAVVLAMLIFAHLGVGFWIVEVGMRVEDVEHARDGTV